jgi:hypothetical protein
MDELMEVMRALDTVATVSVLAVMLIAERRRAEALQSKLDMLYARVMELHVMSQSKSIEGNRN